MPQKSAIVSLLLYAVGIFLHAKGRNLSTDQQAGLEQALGGLFDVVATAILYFQSLHNANKTNIASNHAVLTATALTTGVVAVPPPLVTPTVAGAVVAPDPKGTP